VNSIPSIFVVMSQTRIQQLKRSPQFLGVFEQTT
jgi:hypothetical protein